MTVLKSLEIKNALLTIKDEQKYRDFQIKFPQPFGELPKGITDNVIVIATVELVENDTDDLYVINVTNITKRGFIARVAKIFGTSKVWNEIRLNYTAKRLTLYGGK
jgi:ABC-type antimicrobial peptide transport system ATPase subunit